MAQLKPASALLLSIFVIFVVLPNFTYAFGAGNIGSTSKIEGINWRHGDIEDTLLTILIARAAGGKKFSKLQVKQTYWGSWLRDYSQAIDVGTVKSVSAEAIRIVLWVLGFLSFGYGTREFEVTSERLGCYRPEEHIDNPKDYADNIDARQYDRRLRGPVNEQIELAIDPETGMKNYIANDRAGITTSSGLIRDLFGRCIHLGRQYARSRRENDLFEALRLLGTGLHCLEDFSAHSNYTELALIELGEQDVFPHVGRNCLLQIPGARNRVHPIVTGTFGGVDFLHSVVGEFSDKAKQSEIQELEGAISDTQSQESASMIKNLLDQLPSGLLGGDKKNEVDQLQANATAAQMNGMHITPKQPEEFTRQMQQISEQIYPMLEFHDDIVRSINEAIEKIPVLPALIEQIQNQISIFVFSLMAPFVVPLIKQIKSELATGSSEVIQSSKDKQHNTFINDYEDNPTHSMLSKDHFSNVLNTPAGQTASAMLKWVVPQIMQAWDDERIDPQRTINRITNGVFHHPALRDYGDDGARDCRQIMFGVVQRWWSEQDDRERQSLRDQLSRDGVEQGRNHKEGVEDCGHGCGKPIKITQGQGGNDLLGGITGTYGSSGNSAVQHVQNLANEAAGGGELGGIVGGLVGGVGASLLGGAFGGSNDTKSSWQGEGRDASGGYTQSYGEAAHHPSGRGDSDRWAQSEYKETAYPGGHQRSEYSRYEQSSSNDRADYGYQHNVETRPSYGSGGGFVERTEDRFSRGDGRWETQVQEERFSGHDERESRHHGHRGSDRDSNSGSDSDDWEKKQRKAEKKARKEREERERESRDQGYGDYAAESRIRRDVDESSYGRGGYGREDERRGGGYTESYSSGGGYGRGEESSGREYGRQEYSSSSYSRQEEYSSDNYRRQDEGRRNDYGQDQYESRSSGRRDEYSERPQRGYDGGYEERESGSGGGFLDRAQDFVQESFGGEEEDEGRGYGRRRENYEY